MFERRFAALFATSFVLSAGYGSIYTLLAVIRESFGFSALEVGVIGAVGFFTGFVAQVSLARFADRGHTAGLLRFGLLCAVLGNLAMVFASELAGFVGARALLGLGAGTFAPAARRLLLAEDGDRAGERLGFMASFTMAGFISGPVIASVLFEFVGLGATFVVLAAALIVTTPFVMRTHIPPSTPSEERRAVRVLLALAPVRGTLLCSIAFYITVGVFEAIWAVLLHDKGASQLFIGATLSIFGLPMLVISPFAGRFAQRRGALRTAAMGISGAIPCMLVYGVQDGLVVLAVVVAVHSVFDAFTMPALQLSMAQASPRAHLASGQGLMGATGQLTAALAALLSGWLYGGFGALALFGLSALAMTCLLAGGINQGRSLLRLRALA